jgi:hypothetical protein
MKFSNGQAHRIPEARAIQSKINGSGHDFVSVMVETASAQQSRRIQHEAPSQILELRACEAGNVDTNPLSAGALPVGFVSDVAHALYYAEPQTRFLPRWWRNFYAAARTIRRASISNSARASGAAAPSEMNLRHERTLAGRRTSLARDGPSSADDALPSGRSCTYGT